MYDPSRFKNFLVQNRMKQCQARPESPRMPLSYYVPSNYYDGIPVDQRIPPGGGYTQPQVVPECNNELVQPQQLDDYMFETERFITTLGLNIYDGSTWAMALSLLGETETARAYHQGIIYNAQTCQFGDIRGDHPCHGVIVTGQCDSSSLDCGFCYGQSTSQPKTNAWTFREISDYWSLEGTVDARCPQLGHTWTWNDYKPVLGENAWANLISPLQVALIKFGSIQAIPNDDIAIQTALNFVQSLPSMVEPTSGGLFYAPKNTLVNSTYDLGFTLSLENNVSLLGGLKALRYLLLVKNIYLNVVSTIEGLITSVLKFIKSAYDPSVGYFRQGGMVVNGQFQWNQNLFAVDCQTWTMTQVGPLQVNSWFGQGTAQAIWTTTKKLGGYHLSFDGTVDGVGYSVNTESQVFSGEWSAGAINMLRVFSKELNDPSFAEEATNMRQQITFDLEEQTTIDGVQCTAVKYSNKRYYIPFGWWANPLDAMASTTWSVFLDLNWNPLRLGGDYNSSYPL
eukprot:TRINITY_DN2499_c0_g2_i1.p1 TRINITY_DN2499_c0_g2~~TRINITY_DN2499_c0_g2_i1.p1  ORF type:complete len:558 (+),score=100.70 TRINITY_DN2499_c0_g2_i1:147-1676(+)